MMHRYQKGIYYLSNPLQTEMTQIRQLINAKSSFAAEMILLFSRYRGPYFLHHAASNNEGKISIQEDFHH